MGLLQELKDAKKQAMQAIKMINKPNPDCPDQCKYAQTTHLWICNNLGNDINVEDIAVICMKCGQSVWKITKTKPKTDKPRLPDRTITLNGTQRQLRDNSHGVYVAYLDAEDADWIEGKNGKGN